MELANDFCCFCVRQAKLASHFQLSHAVHQPQADRLGLLAANGCHVCHGLVEVCLGVVAVGVSCFFGPGQLQETRVMNG